ncbi:alpha-amylase family glycosyl hydrolase [Candidatus Pelagibacter sp.]|nr:alpha-amylase family glycosyl hydrolase [Candidatus Pelagibacter sp.]
MCQPSQPDKYFEEKNFFAFQKNQKKISSILRSIYRPSLNENDIEHLKDQIILIIKKFNQKNLKKKITISEKTSLVISYGDNIYSNNTNSIKVFQNFFKKNLDKYFNSIHFLPFYPSSSDSGFAVKDHYKIEKRIGSWSDIKRISKSNYVMADIVINHSSARGLWFKNFLKKKKTW